MDDPVARELLDLFKHTISYDMYGLLAGDPSHVAIPSQGLDKWGGLFVTDDQLATAKYIKEGWLTPKQQAQLDTWNSQTEWMDRAAGRKLTAQEKASNLLELTSAAAIGVFGGRGNAGQSKGASLKEAAADLGYNLRIPPQKAPFDSHGQSVFYNGKQYITPDVDGHNVSNGWKVFDKKGNRLGTYDENLNWVKK
ncbi:toxin C-terminal domain-containing protein [Pseudomonas sp. SDO55104_S430]